MNKLNFSYLSSQIKKLTSITFVRYLLVGCTNTTVCFAAMYIASLFGLHYLAYTAVGYLVAIIYSFFMNLRFTFKVEGKIAKRLLLFFVINLSNLGIVEIIEYILIDIFHWNRLLSILCAMTWYVITGFLINSYLVYSRKIS
ncbi:MAG: GtrA family protein [Legionellaceae bacterium]|nr:GtrA family protein [Legionellaceae bacterium]